MLSYLFDILWLLLGDISISIDIQALIQAFAKCWGHVRHRLLHPFHQAFEVGPTRWTSGEGLDPPGDMGDIADEALEIPPEAPRGVVFLKTSKWICEPGRWGADCSAEACVTTLGWIHWVVQRDVGPVGHEVCMRGNTESSRNQSLTRKRIEKRWLQDGGISPVILCWCFWIKDSHQPQVRLRWPGLMEQKEDTEQHQKHKTCNNKIVVGQMSLVRSTSPDVSAFFTRLDLREIPQM